MAIVWVWEQIPLCMGVINSVGFVLANYEANFGQLAEFEILFGIVLVLFYFFLQEFVSIVVLRGKEGVERGWALDYDLHIFVYYWLFVM